MDFTNRNTQPQNGNFPGSQNPNNQSNRDKEPSKFKKSSRHWSSRKWLRLGAGVFSLAVLAIVVLLIVLIAFSDPKQSKFIATNRYQAVFLNGGQQVYFGHLKNANGDYFDLRDVYFLQSTGSNNSKAKSSSQPNVSLVKLGCQQLHDPYDQMVIQSSQVSFWENLQPNGKVATAIQQYKKDNPNGAKCVDQSQASKAQGSSQGQNSSGSNTQNSSNSKSPSSDNSNKDSKSNTNSNASTPSNSSNNSSNTPTSNSTTPDATNKP